MLLLARVVAIDVGPKVVPVLAEEVDELLDAPGVVLVEVDADIIVLNKDDALDFGQLGQDVAVELVVSYELGLELFSGGVGLLLAVVAGAAGVGVGVAQVQV